MKHVYLNINYKWSLSLYVFLCTIQIAEHTIDIVKSLLFSCLVKLSFQRPLSYLHLFLYLYRFVTGVPYVLVHPMKHPNANQKSKQHTLSFNAQNGVCLTHRS